MPFGELGRVPTRGKPSPPSRSRTYPSPPHVSPCPAFYFGLLLAWLQGQGGTSSSPRGGTTDRESLPDDVLQCCCAASPVGAHWTRSDLSHADSGPISLLSPPLSGPLDSPVASVDTCVCFSGPAGTQHDKEARRHPGLASDAALGGALGQSAKTGVSERVLCVGRWPPVPRQDGR